MDFCAYVPPRHDGSPRFGMFGLADSREGRNFAGNRWGVIFLRKSRAVKQELWLELFPVSKLLACGARLSQPGRSKDSLRRFRTSAGWLFGTSDTQRIFLACS